MRNFTISTLFNQLTAMPKRLAMVLTVLFTIGVGSMWGDITLTTSDVTLSIFSSFSGSGYKTVSNYTISNYSGFSVTDCMLSSGSLQMKASSGKLVSPTIISPAGFDIEITYTSAANMTVAAGGNSITEASVLKLSANSTSTSFTLTVGDKYAVVSKIVLKPKAGTPKSVTLADDNTKLTESSVGGVTLPNRDDCGDWTFVGWCENEVQQTTTKPNVIEAGNYTPSDNITLYPVYTMIESGGGNVSYQYQKVTELSEINAGGTFIITNGNYYLPNTQATNSGPAKSEMVAVTNGVVTGEVTDAMKWNFSAADANKKITITSAANSKYYLYTTNDNNGLRVNTTSDTWVFEEYTVSSVLGFAMKSTSQNRYCAVYTSGSDWRSYTTKNASNYKTNSGILDLYKYTAVGAASTIYYNSNPDCGAPTPTYDLTNDVSPVGYGIVSPTSVEDIPEGTETSTSDNTYTVNGTTVTATPTAATAQYTYAFSKWQDLPATVTADATVTAVFTRTTNKYTITWKNADGTTLKTESLEYEATPSYDGTPTKAQDAQFTYTFKEWSPAIATVTSAQTYTATYTSTLRKYTITFKNWDGSELQNSEVAYGEIPVYNGATPTKAETDQYTYTFNGWTPTIVSVIGTSTSTYTATFTETPRTYSIILNTNGGTINSGNVKEYTYGVGATLPTDITNGNKEFAGWYDNEACEGTPITVISADDTGNKTFWAKWTKITTSLSWSVATCTATIASPSNEFPTLSTTPNDLQGVQYSSSNTDVATIDANGNIILKSAGTTTIRAYKDEDETYAHSSAEYDLIVKKSTNCRWAEVTIDDIDFGDEVVIMMAHGETLYALPYDSENASKSNPLATLITLNEFAGTIADELIWYITKGEDNIFTLSPKTATDKYLTCNSSSNAVRIDKDEERNFTIENGFLKNTSYNTYLAISTQAATPDWRHYESSNATIKNKYQTLKIYKKTCLPLNTFWVDYELANVVCANTPPHSQIANDSEDLLLEFVANDGYKLPESISVSIGNNVLPADNDVYIWDNENGELFIVAAEVTDNIIISISGCERLQAPENLQSSNLTSTSATLSWESVANADSYTVYVTDGTDDITQSTNENTITITGLIPNTLYTWDVIATATDYCENEHSQEWIEFTTLKQFTVTFNANGHGTAPNAQKVDAGSYATAPTAPTTTGYTFAGWYTEAACTNAFDFSTAITGDTTLYANWNIWTYTITYAKGSPAEEISGEKESGTKTYGTGYTLADKCFARSGYEQTGWATSDGGAKVYDLKGIYGTNESITLYPFWTKVHTVTWMADGGQHYQATYLDGLTLELPKTELEACQGSAFMGWTDDKDYFNATTAPTYVNADSEVTADATYYAVYAEAPESEPVEEITKTYTFSEYDGGTQYEENEVHKLDDDVTITTTQCHFTTELRIYSSSTHDGYVVSNALPGRIVSMGFNVGYNKDVLLVYGKTADSEWTLVQELSITSTSYNDYTVDFGETNYTYFKLDVKGSNQIRIKTMTITYMSGSGEPSAAYKNYSTSCSATYRVNYDFTDGEGTCTSESVKVGNDYTICEVEPTKTGYTFHGWNDGTTTHAAGTTILNVQSNITLTAVWEANEYTITWMSNGEEQGTTTHTYDQALEVKPAPYNCYGAKTFVGWTDTETVNADGSDITYIDENTNPSEDKTYYAVFADVEVGELETVEATLSFANKAQRTSFSTTQQVWEQNGITLTNDKASAQSDVGDYANPARFYANSSVSIVAPGYITKIEFTCSSNEYATNLKNSIDRSSASNSIVTIELDGQNSSFVISSLSKQVQMSSLTVTYKSTPEPTRTNFTTTPTACPEFEVAENAYVTSANGQSVKVNVPVKANNFANDMTITAAVEDGNFSVANVSAVTDGACTVTLAYKPTASNMTESATVTLTAKADDDEVTSATFTVNGRSLPETFAIVAKVGGVWYALPEVGYSSEKHATACPVEVDDALEPTCVKSALANNATWSLRQVYQSSGSGDRYAANGTNVVLKNNQEPAMALNASANNSYLLTGAQFNNYHNSSNASRYEWTLSTTDLKTYTFINAERTDKSINISTSTEFGLHANNIVSDELRLLPIDTYYTILAAQVVEWKDNSVVIMYNGNPTQIAQTSINGTNVGSVTLANVQKDIAVYELPADGLGTKPNQTLSVSIGSEKLLLPTPYMVNSEVTDEVLLGSSLNVQARRDIAKVSNLVILKGGKLTSIGAKTNPYIFRNVTIYGGGTLVVSADKGFGANTLTMRVGGVEDGNYKNLYPQLQLKGTLTNSSGQINLDYLTTNEFYYPLSVPYPVTIADIQYPVEIYGANVKLNNTGSFQFKYYDGAERAAGRTGWIVLDESQNSTLNPNTGYAIWGIPKKINGTRQKFGIHRLPLKQTAAKMMENEKKSHEATVNVYNGSKRESDNGWNYLGNPFLSHYGDFTTNDNVMKLGKIVWDEEQGAWVVTDEYQRYVVFTHDCQNYTAELASATVIPAFSAFFIQADQGGAINFASPNVAAVQSIAARRSAEEDKEITTGIIFSSEKLSDRTGLLIADEFTEAYEFNADLSKFDNQDMNLYTISPNGKLAFMAINEELAKQTIPLGYSVSEDGMYTIAFDEQRYNRDDIYALYLIDYDRNETTNLLQMDYEFYSESGANAERFALQVAFAPSTTTDVECTQVGNILVSREGNTLRLDNLPNDATVTVYDAVGHLIEQRIVSQLLQLTLQKGYYLINIGSNQNSVVIDTFIP